jgi:hypothetical protein
VGEGHQSCDQGGVLQEIRQGVSRARGFALSLVLSPLGYVGLQRGCVRVKRSCSERKGAWRDARVVWSAAALVFSSKALGCGC